jgi:hypothetical protein
MIIHEIKQLQKRKKIRFLYFFIFNFSLVCATLREASKREARAGTVQYDPSVLSLSPQTTLSAPCNTEHKQHAIHTHTRYTTQQHASFTQTTQHRYLTTQIVLW